MNYGSLNSKKKNSKTAIIVVLIMIMVLAVSGFGIYRFLNRNRAKYVFDDLLNLDVESIEELSGVNFLKQDFSYTGFEESISDKTFYLTIINLHSEDSSKVFDEPKIGDKFIFEIEANGNSYDSKIMEIVDYHGKGSVEGYVCFDKNLDSEIVIYLLPYFYQEEVSPMLEVLWAPDAIGSIIKDDRPEGSVVEGYCFVITSLEPLEDIHFVSIEKQ